MEDLNGDVEGLGPVEVVQPASQLRREGRRGGIAVRSFKGCVLGGLIVLVRDVGVRCSGLDALSGGILTNVVLVVEQRLYIAVVAVAFGERLMHVFIRGVKRTAVV